MGFKQIEIKNIEHYGFNSLKGKIIVDYSLFSLDPFPDVMWEASLI